MQITTKNREPKMEYSLVEFNLTNPTSSPINVNLFDTNNLTGTPVQLPNNPVPNLNGRQFPSYSTTKCIAIDNTRNNIAIANTSQSFGISNISTTTPVILANFNNIDYAQIKVLIYTNVTDKYYAVKGDRTILEINSLTGQIENTLIFFIGTIIDDLIFCPQNNNLYILAGNLDVIGYVNLYTFNIGSVISIALPPTGKPETLTYVNSNNSIYILNNTDNRFDVVSCSTNTVTTSITLSVGTPSTAIYVQNNDQLYYFDTVAKLIKIIDPTTNTVIGTTIPVAGAKINEMTYSGLTNTIWLFDVGNFNIKTLDATNNTLSTILSTPITSTSGKIEYSTSLNSVYITFADATTPYIQELISSSQFYISGSTDYNLFTQDSLANPKRIDRIMIYGETNANLDNNLVMNKVDATGDSCAYPMLPDTVVASNQFQGQIAQLDVKDFILDVTTDINYTIPAFTTIKWIMYYKEYVKSDMLVGRVMIKEFDSMLVDNPDTYDEKYLIDTALGNNWSESIELKKLITK